MTTKKLFLLPLGCFVWIAAAAQTDTSQVKQLDDVVVTANRSAQKLNNVAVPVTIIPAKTIRQTGSQRLQDILQEQTGVIIVNSNLATSLNGYPNPFGQGVQMLGLDPAYTLILLDGEPLVGRNAGILKLGRLATGNIRQVEIVKGPASSLYGSEALAGVINIITDAPQEEKASFQLHAASHGTVGATASYGNKFGKTGVQFFLNRYSSSGYDLDPALYGKTIDPYRNWYGHLKITQEIAPNWQWILSLRDYDSKQSNNYQVYVQNDPAIAKGYTSETDRSAFTQLRWTWKDNAKLFFRTFYDRYANQSYVNLEKTGELFDETSFDQSIVKPEVQLELGKPGQQVFVAGAGSYFETISASRYAGRRRSSTAYLFAQQEWKAFHQRITVNAGARLDKRNDISARLSPRLAMAFQPNAHWKLTASVGWGFKAPDFRHLFLNFFNSQVGYSLLGTEELGTALQTMQQQGLLQPGANISPYEHLPSLHPETSVGSHVGIKYSSGRWMVDGSLFRNDIRNLIDVFTLPFTRSNGGSIFSYHNIGRVYTQGVTFDLRYTVTPVLFISGGYQFLDAKDKDILDQIRKGTLYKRDALTFQTTTVKRSDYFGLFNRSRHTGNLKLTYDNPATGWNVYLRGIYRGKYGYGDLNGDAIADDRREMVKGHLLLNMAIAKTITSKLQVQGGIENILNYINSQKLPDIPGRLYFININYSIGKINQHKKTT